MKRTLLTSTILQASGTLGLQLLAMVALAPRDFGAFSLVYLAAAFGQSIMLSVLVDPWLFARKHVGHDPAVRRQFAAVLAWLAVCSGLVAGVAAFIATGEPWAALLSTVASAAALYRAGSRDRCLVEGDRTRVLAGDAAALGAVVIGTAVAVTSGGLGVLGIFAVWSGSAAAAALVHGPPESWSLREVGSWLRQRWPRIKSLLADSLLMDLGAIGTPYVIGGLAGLAALGIYRGVSNVAAPVRLVLNPLRPIIVQSRMTRSRWLLVAAASLVFGAGAWAGLQLLALTSLSLGTLTELAPLAVPIAIFVAANCMGHTAYLVARGSASGGGLMLGRVIQTVLAIVVPIGGVLVAGIPGAAWGLALATACSAMSWTGVAVIGARAKNVARVAER